jgi:MFS transporter, AAHS family, 4-hydroxybenzoate transporter
MSEARQIDIASVIETMPIGRMRLQIFAVCFFIQLMDGFDTQAIGFAAKPIAADLHMSIALFGQVFSAGLFGAMTGAFVFGPLADRFGRRRMLVAATTLFSGFTLLTSMTYDFHSLLACRFLAGLGLGGAIPNLLALSSEYMPKRYRGLLTGVLFAAFPLGGFVGALTSANVIPLLGWPALFYIGGAVPLVLALISLAVLPDSIQYLLKRAENQQIVDLIARNIDPGLPKPDEITFVDREEKPVGAPISCLFSSGRATPTLLLWVSFFMCFVLLIVLVLWTPALMRQAGIGETAAAMIAGLINLGSVVGTSLGGRLVDRFGPHVVVPTLFLSGALAVSILGYATRSLSALGLCATLSGFFLGGASAGLLAVVVLIYPSLIRGTGLGWSVAVARMGQVTGPLIVGALVSEHLAVDRIFLWCAAPAAIAASATFAMRWCRLSAESAMASVGRAVLPPAINR